MEVNGDLDVCMATQNSVEILGIQQYPLELAQKLHTVNRRQIPGRVGGKLYHRGAYVSKRVEESRLLP